MADSKLKIDIRRNKILERLRETGVVRVTELSRELGVTPVTVRTDLASLEQEGYLDRVQGGAVVKERMTEVQETPAKGTEEKLAIAAETVRQIPDGSTLFINSGTTTRYVAAALKQRKGINIVTNSMAVVVELGDVSGIHVILLGGEFNAQYGYTYGEDAKAQLGRYRADLAILSVDGVSVEAGITTFHADEAMIDKMMMERSGKTMIVADHSKIGRAGFTCLAQISQGVELVTDGGCDKEKVARLEAQGLRTTVV